MDSAFRRSYAAVEEALSKALGSGVDAGRTAEELWSVTRAVEANPVLRRSLADATREGADKAALAERLLQGKVGQGALFLTQAVAKIMIAAKKQQPDFPACIVNVSSISATVASVSRGEYCISKAGVSMATQLWAVRLGEYGIGVYEIRPGVIKTDMTAVVQAKYDKLISEGLCLQARWGFPDDIGRAVAMLARGDLAYSTGQVILVDGGITVPRL